MRLYGTDGVAAISEIMSRVVGGCGPGGTKCNEPLYRTLGHSDWLRLWPTGGRVL